MDVKKRAAAEQGYNHFRQAQSTPTITDVNARLEAAGLPGIRDRTYKHYRRLLKHGVVSYVPINEFDVSLKHRAS